MGKVIVLLVSDDTALQRMLVPALESRGYRVLVESSTTGALEVLDRQAPDLVVLDSPFMDAESFWLLNAIRLRSAAPVVIVSLNQDRETRVRALEVGADDFVTKPVHVEELVARIRAVLRRACPEPAEHRVLRYDRVTIDLGKRRVFVDGEEIHLSRTEWSLLEQLARNPGRVMRHAELLSHVWGPEFAHETYYLRTWVSRLRSKLRDEIEPHRVIVTRPGIGYLLAEPVHGVE